MWTLRSRIIWHRSQKRRILCGRSATTSRSVLEAHSSQKPQSATVRLSLWKGAPNNAEGKAKQCIGVMMSFCSILLCFLKCGEPMLGVKANRSALEYSSSKADELKVEFSAEWLRIWRYERSISHFEKPYTSAHPRTFCYKTCTRNIIWMTCLLFIHVVILTYL